MVVDTCTQKYMAREGTVQWLAAAVLAGRNLENIYQNEFQKMPELNAQERRMLALRAHAEGNYFASAAKQVISYADWLKELNVYPNVDFSELEKFNRKHITDLRNMREHVIDYFKGGGRDRNRWSVETPEYSSDASGVVGTKIGGRVDYIEFPAACESVLRNILTFEQEHALELEEEYKQIRSVFLLN